MSEQRFKTRTIKVARYSFTLVSHKQNNKRLSVLNARYRTNAYTHYVHMCFVFKHYMLFTVRQEEEFD